MVFADLSNRVVFADLSNRVVFEDFLTEWYLRTILTGWYLRTPRGCLKGVSHSPSMRVVFNDLLSKTSA